MTREEKLLWLKDLCCRIPYHPKGHVVNACNGVECDEWLTCATFPMFTSITNNSRLYLRPMPSMTEEEKGELWFLLTEGRTNIELNSNGQLTTRENIELGFNYPFVCPEGSTLYVDWLNKHHFDYRGLIAKGLALEAPKGMYNLDKLSL